MEQILGVPASVAEVFITDELLTRATPEPDYLREKLAIQDLAHQMADHPAEVLPRLVALAMQICDADSAGVSVLDGAVFRWLGLQGKLAVFEHATTPRNHSPCGVCLDRGDAILMAHPERAYDWIANANIVVPEVLLVPLLINGKTPLGTLWVVAKEGQHFNAGHARVMAELAVFSGVALRMIQADTQLKTALEQQEVLTKEMSHRVKNLLAVTDSLVRMTSRSSSTKEQMTENLTGRLHALSEAHTLVQRSFSAVHDAKGVDLAQVIRTVLRPYREPEIDGPPLALGEHATNSIALVFHELATNAAKYGSCSSESGSVALRGKSTAPVSCWTGRRSAARPFLSPGPRAASAPP